MNDYVKATFHIDPVNETRQDLLSALLCQAGGESFVNTDDGIEAYIPANLFDVKTVTAVVSQMPTRQNIIWEYVVIEGRDWNEEWEKNYFAPIVVSDRCVIHSSFHHDYPKMELDVTIDPKMAFGTGHHDTTTLMIEQLFRQDLSGKQVLDVGTGTGILAIVASKLGATACIGIEIDEFAYNNALENVAVNKVENVQLLLGDASLIEQDRRYDVVMANINRNIITADIARYASALKPGGLMQLSGFYDTDIDAILETATQYGLSEEARHIRNRWAMLALRMSSE